MRRGASLIAIACALVFAAGAMASSPLQLVQTGGASYPQRSYLLTLGSPRSLAASQIRVTENGVPVRGLSVAREGVSTHGRSAVVLLIDESLTMKGKPLAQAFAAARAFAVQAAPTEEVGVVTFNGAVDVLEPLTTSAIAVSDALARTPPVGYGTRNYDALLRALALIKAAHVATGAVIILTDGQSVGSHATPAQALAAFARAHVRVFSVGLYSPAYNAAALERMASLTGGSYVEATSSSKVTPIFESIGARLSREYIVSYRSRAEPGMQVHVQVAVSGLGSAASSYATPALHIAPAAPYVPSKTDSVLASPILAAVVIIGVAALIFFAFTQVFAQRGDPLVTRVGGFVNVAEPVEGPRESQEEQRRQIRRTLIERATRAGGPRSWSEHLAVTLELADIDTTPMQVVLLTACSTLILAFVLDAVIGVLGFLAGLLIAPYVARRFIRLKLQRRRRAFAEQLPDNLDVLASALRAGHSLVGALTVVADDATEPSKTEYQRVLAEEQFGVQLEDALKVAADRMDNADLEQVALVARLQREMGSNAAEVLDKVIETVRGRMELRRLVRTLTAQGRLSRWVLTGLPLGLAIILSLLDSGYMHPLFHTLFGQILLVVAVAMVTAGSFVIGKIIDIKA